MAKKIFKTSVAVVLMIYGIAGIIASIIGINLIWKYDWNLNTMSNAMNDASSASTNTALGIRNAKDALNIASTFTQRSGNALHTISNYVGFEVLGWQPFGRAYSYFIDSGDNLNSLSGELIKTANSLETNAQGMERLSRDFKEMSVSMGNLEWQSKNMITYVLWYFASLHLVIFLIGILVLII